MNVQTFVESFQNTESAGGAAGFSPYNFPPTTISNLLPKLGGGYTDLQPSGPGTVSGVQGFTDALRNAAQSALKAVTPGQDAGVAQATVAASEGIKAGFTGFTFWAIVLAVLYLFGPYLVGFLRRSA